MDKIQEKNSIKNLHKLEDEEEDFTIDILVKIRKLIEPSKQFKTRFYARPHTYNCDRSLDKRKFRQGSRITKTSMCWADDYSIRTY